MAKMAINIQLLTRDFGDMRALDSLSLDVPAGIVFGFLEPNGAGKTTTIKLMLGLIRPSSGSAIVFGMDCIRHSVDIRAWVGYLPQEPHFYEHMTAASQAQVLTTPGSADQEILNIRKR